MATDQAAAPSDDECEIALEAAVGVALDHCRSERDLQRVLGQVLGVEPDANCEQALREGLDDQTCSDSAGLRQYVACRAWDLLRSEDIAFQDAMEEAWAEAHQECNISGGVV